MEQITHFHEHHQQLPAKLTSAILQICHCQLQDSTWTHPFPSHQPFVTMTHSSKLNWDITVTKKPSHSPPTPLRFPFLLPVSLPSVFHPSHYFVLVALTLLVFTAITTSLIRLWDWLSPPLDHQLFQGWNSDTHVLGPDAQQASTNFSSMRK